MKPLLTCFTQEGDYLAISSPDGTVKVILLFPPINFFLCRLSISHNVCFFLFLFWSSFIDILFPFFFPSSCKKQLYKFIVCIKKYRYLCLFNAYDKVVGLRANPILEMLLRRSVVISGRY